MGVRGLYSFLAFTKKVYEIIDLVREAEIKGVIEILVDFNPFRRYLNEVILKIVMNKFKNPYLSLLCSEYDIYFEAFLKFHKSFADAGIKLVYIVDSAKGLDAEVNDQKSDVWSKRRNISCARVNNLMNGCNSKIPPDKLENVSPLYNAFTIIDRLKISGAEVIQLLQGGSDEFIASEFKKRKSFAILTGDTDFLIFPDCTVIFLNSMKVEYGDDLLLPFIDIENPGEIFKKPDKFRCPIFDQRKTIEEFEMENSEQLIILSIIKGNDNTIIYAENLQNHLNLTTIDQKVNILDVVKYICKKKINLENIFQIPEIMSFLKEFPAVEKSFKFCFDFYTLKHFRESEDTINFDRKVVTDPLTDYFREKLASLEINFKIYTIHLGFYQDTIVPENLTESSPSITSVLLNIRSKIYPYILHENINQVLEKRHRESEELVTINVEHALIKTNRIIGKLDSESERQNGVVYGIDLFQEIWSHLEDDQSLNLINRFGYEIGFICYILRYFYKITNNINIRLSIKEFTALFAAVFYQYGISKNVKFDTSLNRDTFMGMKICPSEKCFIILGWFTEIYYHGKHLCGNCLNLTEYFPSIEIVISSSAYTAFYENAMNNINGRLSHLNKSIHKYILNLKKQILKKFIKEYEIVIQ